MTRTARVLYRFIIVFVPAKVDYSWEHIKKYRKIRQATAHKYVCIYFLCYTHVSELSPYEMDKAQINQNVKPSHY